MRGQNRQSATLLNHMKSQQQKMESLSQTYLPIMEICLFRFCLNIFLFLSGFKLVVYQFFLRKLFAQTQGNDSLKFGAIIQF